MQILICNGRQIIQNLHLVVLDCPQSSQLFLPLFLRAAAISIIQTPLYKSPGSSNKAMPYDPKFPLSVERSIFLLGRTYFGIMGTLSFAGLVTIYSRMANIDRSSNCNLGLGSEGEMHCKMNLRTWLESKEQ